MSTSANVRLRNLILPRELAAAVRHRRLVGVILISFPTLKEVNSKRGYETGDWLLEQASIKISEFAKTDECLLRVSGAKFCLILPLLREEAILEMVLARLDDQLSTPYQIAASPLFMPPKLGATYADGLGVEAGDLLNAVEAALRNACDSTKNWTIVETAAAPKELLKDLQSELKSAIEQNKLTLFFQPQVDLVSGQCIGFEALTRWQHLNTYISPDFFIPYAERSELIHQITNWTLHNSLRQLKELDEHYAGDKPLTVSLNVSGRCLDDDFLFRSIHNALAIWNVDPERLIIELTETAFMKDLTSAADACNRLKQQLGVEISLDDFGLGYSGLEILNCVNASELKIDRMFVDKMCSNERSLKIVAGLVKLADSLGMRTVAEGIESPETVSALLDMPAHLGQGFFFSKPLAESQVVAWLENHNHHSNPP